MTKMFVYISLIPLLIPLYIIIRVFRGLHLNLYFLNVDSSIEGQKIIPVNQYRKRKSLFKKNWNEDLEVTLSDYKGNNYVYEVKYGLWRHYYFSPKDDKLVSMLNDKKLIKGTEYNLKNGMNLKVGNRNFKVAVTTRVMGDIEIFGLSTRI